MVKKEKEYCIISLMFHDPGGRGAEWDESRTIIVNRRDFDKINNEIERRINNETLINVEEFIGYLDELDEKGVYYFEVVESFVHDVVI
jgi:hypothetical protein